jgi:hypothetical protein
MVIIFMAVRVAALRKDVGPVMFKYCILTEKMPCVANEEYLLIREVEQPTREQQLL